MTLTITQAGSFTTIQDQGRYGLAHLGIPVSGTLDGPAAEMANWLVGNEPGEGVLEVTWTGLAFITEVACSVAVAGAEFDCQINQRHITTDDTIQLQAGDHFKMAHLSRGVRAYLAVAGGFAIEPMGGSVSTLSLAGLGGMAGRALQVGDVLALKQPCLQPIKHKLPWRRYQQQSIHVIRAMPGPEVNAFDPVVVRQAFGQPYQLTKDCSRQGFRLQAEAIPYPRDFTMSSSGLVPGSLQVTPDGQTILTMADGQTTGGYPRILVVNQDELHKLAQIRPGEDVYFFRSG